jgi:hypothetical protein
LVRLAVQKSFPGEIKGKSRETRRTRRMVERGETRAGERDICSVSPERYCD